MTLSFKHAFTTPKADGTDATLLRPSNWNAEHVISLANNTLIGRASAGAGVAEEIPVTAATLALLAAADIPAILAYLGISPPQPGDVKTTFRLTADPGWVLCDDGTIGPAGSGATNRANNDTLALFTILFNNVPEAYAPLFTSLGATTPRSAYSNNPAIAWANGCRQSLTKMLGRVLGISQNTTAGATLTQRNLGQTLGTETATLITGNLPPYTPAGGVTNGAITIANLKSATSVGDGVHGSFSYYSDVANQGTVNTNPTQAASSFAGAAQGGTSTPFSLMQPTSFVNAMVKL